MESEFFKKYNRYHSRSARQRDGCDSKNPGPGPECQLWPFKPCDFKQMIYLSSSFLFSKIAVISIEQDFEKMKHHNISKTLNTVNNQGSVKSNFSSF